MTRLLMTLALLLTATLLFAQPDQVKFKERRQGPRHKQVTADTLRIVTWNLEHFVDPFDNPYIKHEREDHPDSLMRGRPERFARAVRALNADVLIVEEFESQAYLRRIVAEFFPDMGYKYFASSESPEWYMNVVVMSRVPLGVLHSYGNISTPIIDPTGKHSFNEMHQSSNARMWSVEVQPVESYQFILTGLHLKAGRNLKDTLVREGQIGFIKQQLKRFLKENRKANLLVAGDLNCTPQSRELSLFVRPDERLKLIDPLAKSGIFSHPSSGPFWRIDYILVNDNMQDELLKDSTQVILPLDISEMRQISDHLPVKADFIIWK